MGWRGRGRGVGWSGVGGGGSGVGRGGADILVRSLLDVLVRSLLDVISLAAAHVSQRTAVMIDLQNLRYQHPPQTSEASSAEIQGAGGDREAFSIKNDINRCMYIHIL